MSTSMWYYPYFRGKQYELIALRETADVLASAGVVPIVEPVKRSLVGLQKTIDTLCTENVRTVVTVNPSEGDFRDDASAIRQLLGERYSQEPLVEAGIKLREKTTISDITEAVRSLGDKGIALIHDGFPDAKGLRDELGDELNGMLHVFVEGKSSKLYRRRFDGTERVLLRDGFERRAGRDYPDVEFFSDLHVTYRDEGMDGFGDFSVVGDEYSETGGPAYAVAIHVTFIDDEHDEVMRIYHFKSDRADTPTDPAGKFSEALAKLVASLDTPGCRILETEAIGEFRQLHDRRHFPGLGYVKKLSMKHHIETLAEYRGRH